MMKKIIVGTGEKPVLLRNGIPQEPINNATAPSFPVGFRFLYQQFPYNSVFTVVEQSLESGISYRRIQSILGDDVYIDVKQLQLALQSGDATLLPIDLPAAPIPVPANLKAKPKKKAKKVAKKSSKKKAKKNGKRRN
jgi:hypothetical protein